MPKIRSDYVKSTKTLAGVRVREDELAAYRAAAEREGVSVSDWVRAKLNAAVGGKP